jgi:hypothetical protein
MHGRRTFTFVGEVAQGSAGVSGRWLEAPRGWVKRTIQRRSFNVVAEVMVNGPDEVFVERKGRIESVEDGLFEGRRPSFT